MVTPFASLVFVTLVIVPALGALLLFLLLMTYLFEDWR